jgi:hypothetical protein
MYTEARKQICDEKFHIKITNFIAPSVYNNNNNKTAKQQEMIKYSMSKMRMIANLIWKTNQNENFLMEEIQQKLNYICFKWMSYGKN